MRWLKTTRGRTQRNCPCRKAKNWCRVSTRGDSLGFPCRALCHYSTLQQQGRWNRSAQSCLDMHATRSLGSFEKKASILLKPLSFSGNELTLRCFSSMEIVVSWSFCPPDSFCVSILFCHQFLDNKPKGRLYFYSNHKLIKRSKSLNDPFVHAKYVSQKSIGPLFFHIIFKRGHCLCLFKEAEKSYKSEKKWSSRAY